MYCDHEVKKNFIERLQSFLFLSRVTTRF